MNALSVGLPFSGQGARYRLVKENDNARLDCCTETDSACLLVDGCVCSGMGTFRAGELQEWFHRAAGDRRRKQISGAGVSANADTAGQCARVEVRATARGAAGELRAGVQMAL